MAQRVRIAIVAAIFFGFIAAYGIYNFLHRQRQEVEAMKKVTQNVVVAGKDIPAGTALTDKNVKEGLIKVSPWPKDSVPKGAFASTQQVLGKVAKIKVFAGEPLLESRMAGEGAGLTVRLSPGNRGMAVKIDEIIGVSGFIAPDDRVDVIATTTPPGKETGEKISKVVLQNKRVLSVAQATEQKEGKPQVARSITLEVTPEEAEKLSLASLDGQIVLALRAIGDDKIVKTEGSNKRELLALASRRTPQVKPQSRPEKYQVEVYLGSKRSVVEF